MNCSEVELFVSEENSIATEEDNIFQRSNFVTQKDESQSRQAGVLPEDHPLLQQFQQSLNNHLLRVQEQLLSEISEIDHNLKVKEQQREEIGSKLYDRQIEIGNQNHVLEDYLKQMNDISSKRITYEKNVGFLKKEYDDKLALHKEVKRCHNERLMELTSLQALENNIQKWSTETSDEIEAAKRVVNKDSKDQQKISDEKRKMDLLLLNLDTEVRKREQELDDINEQIKDQKNVMTTLNTNLSDANSDLEVLQQEHKRLNQAWNEVIIAIQHRDKILFEVREDLNSEIKKEKLLTSDIEATKKTAAQEIEQNEKLESFKARIEDEFKSLEKQVDKQLKENSELANKLEKLTNLLEQTEKDYYTTKIEGNGLQVQLRSIQIRFDKQATRKMEIEEKILDLVQEQITTDKASEYRMKLLRMAQEQRRTLEVTLSQVENQVSLVLLDLEKMKGIIVRIKEDDERLMKSHCEINSIVNQYSDELKSMENSITMKMKLIDQLSKKLDNVITAIGGQEQSAVDMKIADLEINIQENEQKIRELQNFWLMLQGHVVNLSEKRSAQMNDIQIARKQLLVIDQKTIKIDNELSETAAVGKETSRNIQNLNTKLNLSCAKLFEKKKTHQNEELECQHNHLDLIENLREQEMLVLSIEQEIHDISEEIEIFKIEVLERHREALSWETKYKMAEEMNRWRNEEKSAESEIGCMKAEIHRMDIRYNQLKRAQEKLVQDLEHCVMHREQIFFTANRKQKTDNNQNRSRSSIQHKLNELKNKFKIIQQEINVTERNLCDMTNQYQNIFTEVTRKHNDIENEKLQDNLIQSEIEQGMLLKHQNLENIIRKQHRAKRYRGLASSRSLPKAKNETVLMLEMQKQHEINHNVIDIVQTILNDFPDKIFYLTRILQALRDE